MAVDIPIFINVRDRVTPLRELVAWLERAGHERIVLLDNDSAWPPLLEYLKETPHTVHRFGENLGSQSLWRAGMVPDERFVFTDPDIVPIEDCPFDAVAHLASLLDEYPEHRKAGLGLYLDDLPRSLPCLEWERSLVSPLRQVDNGVFDSMIDTTFALYEPGSVFGLAALRTGHPYQARHVSWYVTPGRVSAEDRYYLKRAKAGPGASSWAQGQNWPAAA